MDILIGQDFEKIEFTLLGLDLVEPNALIGNLILSLLSFYFAFRLKNMEGEKYFTGYWMAFFFTFGLSFFFGGLGHSLWNYWGINGKILPWGCSLISIYMLEQAMISIHKIETARLLLKKISHYKLMLSATGMIIVIYSFEVGSDLSKAFIIPSVHATLGILFSLLLLPLYYKRKHYGDLNYFIISVFVLLPSSIFQAFKINFHPWMDKNDVAHIFMFLAFMVYFHGVKRYIHSQKRDSFNSPLHHL